MTKTVEARTTLPAPPEGYGEPIYGVTPNQPHVCFFPSSQTWKWFDGWCGDGCWYALPLPKLDSRVAWAIEQIANAVRDALAAIESARFSKFKLLERAVIHENRRRALARMFAHQDDKPSVARTRYVLLEREQNAHD